MPDPDPPPPKSLLPRSIRRVLVEALAVAFLGALVYGTFWELQFPDAGLIVAGVLWIAGAPALELIRLHQSRK